MDDEKSVTGSVDEMTEDYIAAINELKQNTVDRQKYDQLKAENKKLLESIVNGQEIDLRKAPQQRSVEELRKDLFSGQKELSNLDFIVDALELRKALIAEGEADPFLPIGNQISPSDADVAAAEKVAQVLQDCVDYADGDSAVFTNELQRRMVDVKIR